MPVFWVSSLIADMPVAGTMIAIADMSIGLDEEA